MTGQVEWPGGAAPHVARELLAAAAPDDHLVQFYDDERFLYDVVADFLGAGLAAGEPIVVVATRRHEAAFLAALEARGHDVAAGRAAGMITLLDAEETLASFMVDGSPDWTLFAAAIAPVVEASRRAAGGRSVRAYGEMVDVLWRAGNADAAIRLEELWNDLAKLHPFSLLCAYLMSNFRDGEEGRGFKHVCRTHSHALPTEAYATLAAEDLRLREVALLQQRAQELESEIERRKVVEAALVDALAVRDDFLAIAGHELRTPLTALQLNLDSLTRMATPCGDERIAERVGRAARQSARLGALIDRLLDVPRLSAGGLVLDTEPCDLAALVRETVERASDLAVQARCSVAVTADEPVLGRWDRTRLEEVMGNLLSNAFKHARGRPVTVVATREGDRARIVVRDGGPGVPPALHQKIFRRFAHSEAARKMGGLGLGLWMARQIVETHGGTITLDSAPEAGTTFTVDLPC